MMKWGRYHWRHYFGGVALVLLLLQLLTGIFLGFFYSPHLKEAYASVQYLYNQFPTGGLVRDGHRWLAFLLLVAVIVHSVRSLLRRDFQRPGGAVTWVTGALLLPLLLAFLATGFILPWEWRGYWFMEMIPNAFGFIPVVGPAIKAFLIEVFTLNRTLIVHVVVLPFLAFILMEYHIFAKLHKRSGGILRYIPRHGLLALPFLVAVMVLAYYIPTPTQDPQIVPMPLEGAFIPTAEWFLLIFWVPFFHYAKALAPWVGMVLPLVVFVLLALLPFYFKPRGVDTRGLDPDKADAVLGAQPVGFGRRVWAFSAVLVTVSVLFGGMFMVTYRSPTLGCNSCHNIAMGERMGIPPDAFKNRNIVPLLEDDGWMTRHWFIPTHVW
ncbi:MAG: cytochrome b N-terminal domain-containing protein [Magnetococcus sp. DMHC-8]